MRKYSLTIIMFIFSLCACAGKSVHVFVALADNENQGIVPVSKALGDGNNPSQNLYWGALYGIKAYFKRSKEWQLKQSLKNPVKGVLERLLFVHKSSGTTMVADAYRGSEIKQATIHFLESLAGKRPAYWPVDGRKVPIYGKADLCVYIGHNGLMDFSIDTLKLSAKRKETQAIILACQSKNYFLPWLEKVNASSLLLTTNFMAPEAYTLKSALDGWINGESNEQIREKAASAYSKYQKCSLNAARRLFYTDESEK